MRIAVIGWGSLIWCPGDLAIASRWKKNGPCLPVEFSRVSNDCRLTLVIADGVDTVTTLWAVSEYTEMRAAMDNLRHREGIPDTPWHSNDIGQVAIGDTNVNQISQTIREWLQELRMDGAIWTALPPKDQYCKQVLMTPDQAVAYVRGLCPQAKRRAEEYVRNAPDQIETQIRKRLRDVFGWENNLLSRVLFEDNQRIEI